MISVFNLNPTLDIIAPLDKSFKPGVTRVKSIKALIGGKASNTARALASLGVRCVLSGFMPGGSTGESHAYYRSKSTGFKPVFVDGSLRPCLLISSGRKEYTVNSSVGVLPSEPDVKKLLKKIALLTAQSKAAVFSGSVPHKTGSDIYYRCLTAAHRGCITILDASGLPLKEGIKASPHTVKINSDEAADAFGADLSTTGKARSFLGALALKHGINTIIITSGAGRIHAYRHGFYYSFIPPAVKGRIHPAGSGDAFTAGYCFGVEKGFDFEKSVSYGVSCAHANLFNPEPCTFSKKEALEIVKTPRR